MIAAKVLVCRGCQTSPNGLWHCIRRRAEYFYNTLGGEMHRTVPTSKPGRAQSGLRSSGYGRAL